MGEGPGRECGDHRSGSGVEHLGVHRQRRRDDQLTAVRRERHVVTAEPRARRAPQHLVVEQVECRYVPAVGSGDVQLLPVRRGDRVVDGAHASLLRVEEVILLLLARADRIRRDVDVAEVRPRRVTIEEGDGPRGRVADEHDIAHTGRRGFGVRDPRQRHQHRERDGEQRNSSQPPVPPAG